MTSYVISTTQVTTENLTASDDDLLVTDSGSIIQTTVDGDGVESTAADQEITIDGLVYSTNGYSNTGVDISGAGTSLTVNGQVQSDAGVDLTGSSERVLVGSQGSINGGNWGVIFFGNSSDPIVTDNSLVNAGDISGSIAVASEFGGGDTIDNSGRMSGESGVNFFDDVSGETVENSGTITAANSFAIDSEGSSVGIEVVNSGLITDGGANPIGANVSVLDFEDTSGTTSTIDNAGAITGAGYVIQSLSDILDISNSGTIHGGLYSTAKVDVDNSGHWKGQAGSSIVVFDLVHNHDVVTNAQGGTIAGGITLAAGGDRLANAGDIDGSIKFTGAGATNTLVNSGSITGNIVFSSASSTFANHGQMYGNVALAASDTLTNTGVIDGNVTLGANDTAHFSYGEVEGAIGASSNDLLAFGGHFGDETINKFVAGSGSTHDRIQFAADEFATFAAVQMAMTQVGANVTIRLDATDSLTLDGVQKASFVAADFKFL